MSDSRTPRPNQFQPKHPYTYMHSRMNVHSTSTSTIVLWLASSTIWLKPLIQTSCTQPIRLPSTHPIQGRHMAMRFFIWLDIWRRLPNWVCISSPIPARVLNAIVMLTSQDCGTRPWHQWTPVLTNHEAVGLSSMQDVLSPGPPNSNPKLHFPSLRLNILLCHRLSGMSFLLWDFYRKWGKKGVNVLCNKPHVYCKVFEEYSGALELARLPKLHPRTKHINVCYHHFREHVRKGIIKTFPVNSKDQIADALTKALAQNDFQRHCRFMCGKWPHKQPKWGSFRYSILWHLF